MRKPITIISSVISLFLLIAACEKDEDNTSQVINNPQQPETIIDPGSDPNFKIVKNENPFFKNFNRKVSVFGVTVYAVEEVEDDNLLHVANVVAQYIDNNEDSIPDHKKVQESVEQIGSYITISNSTDDFIDAGLSGFIGFNLLESDINLEFVSKGRQGQFDKTLEVVSKMVFINGYSKVLPTTFAAIERSQIANAMRVARGGSFDTIPSEYPDRAWYTNYAENCDFECQVTEYFYWCITSFQGAHIYREEEINGIWKLNTPDKFRSDADAYAILTYPLHNIPTELPDGTYRP